MNSFFIKYFAKYYINIGLSAYTYTITQTYVCNMPKCTFCDFFFGVKMSHASVEITQLTGNDTKKGL